MDGVGHAGNAPAGQGGGEGGKTGDGVIFVACTNRRDAIDPAVRHTAHTHAHAARVHTYCEVRTD